MECAGIGSSACGMRVRRKFAMTSVGGEVYLIERSVTGRKGRGKTYKKFEKCDEVVLSTEQLC